MCLAPRGYDGALEEVNMGFAMSTKRKVWMAGDTPMLLHVFEHIVRNALLKWWNELALKKAL